MTTLHKLLVAQLLVLFGGTVFAWSKLIPQITHFISENGTLLRFGDTASPNPLTTACLYGSTAFLVVLFWSVRLYQEPLAVSQRYLRNALLFCVVFAASVVAYEVVAFYKLFGVGTNAFICTPGVPPTETPCFTGMLFFIAAFVIALFTVRRIEAGEVAR